jgi:DNA modification methylase
MSSVLMLGDCRERLKELADCSVDSVVTDPPYELGFMGKSWDSTGVAYDVTVWQECLRVLKPGGHLLAFGGSRTYHRLAVAIEDAGFQIRDQIMWVYGSGFPKSLNISKAIDKMDAKDEQQARRYRFTAWVRSTGVTSKQIDEATNTNMGGHYTTEASQPAVMTREHLEACRQLLGDIPRWVEIECDIRSVESKNFASREVVGIKKNAMAGWSMDGTTRFADRSITTPSTDEAEQWDGWGTALKPAHEPIVMARKPLDGTVANNVLVHGVGGINIDGCRVGRADGDDSSAGNRTATFGTQDTLSGGDGSGGWSQNDAGRFPANFIHDGSDEVLELFPYSKTGSKKPHKNISQAEYRQLHSKEYTAFSIGDSGSAARFFYCAKANKEDRNKGLDGFEEKRPDERSVTGMGTFEEKGVAKQANHHPTVKPTDLMRYLCRLVTPPNGTVLDPFTGSGSTGKAAVAEGFSFIGVEQSEEYLAIAKARIEAAQ